jgi:hypothetical protein
MKNFFIGLCSGVILVIGVGVLCDYFREKKEPEIRIVKETKTEFKYIQHPLTCEEYKICYESQLNILGGIEEGNVFHVSVFDFCKKAEKDFILKTISKDVYKRTVLLNYGFISIDKKMYSLYGLTFTYRWRFVSFGLSGNTNLQNNIYMMSANAGISF